MIHELFDITGKKAIVTGGARGIGSGITEALLEAGCEVVIVGSNPNTSEKAETLNKKGHLNKCYGISADLGVRENVQSAFDKSMELLGGKLDILVCCAGIVRRGSAEIHSLKDWDDVLNVNLQHVFVMNQLAGRVMLKEGYGKIINISSIIHHFGGNTIPGYAAAKGGVTQLTKELSNDWASRGVNVNCIAPGYVATDINEAILADTERYHHILSRIPYGRWANPDDFKGAVIFLASHASDYVCGAVLDVDGGYSVK